MEGKHLKEANSNARVAHAYAKLVQLIKSSTSRAETPS